MTLTPQNPENPNTPPKSLSSQRSAVSCAIRIFLYKGVIRKVNNPQQKKVNPTPLAAQCRELRKQLAALLADKSRNYGEPLWVVSPLTRALQTFMEACPCPERLPAAPPPSAASAGAPAGSTGWCKGWVPPSAAPAPAPALQPQPPHARPKQQVELDQDSNSGCCTQQVLAPTSFAAAFGAKLANAGHAGPMRQPLSLLVPAASGPLDWCSQVRWAAQGGGGPRGCK